MKGRKERKGKSTAVLLDDAVLLRHSQQTGTYHLVELLECMQQNVERNPLSVWPSLCVRSTYVFALTVVLCLQCVGHGQPFVSVCLRHPRHRGVGARPASDCLRVHVPVV